MISIEHISKSFQHEIIFHSVSFTMEKGEILSIVGPSGTGKSTFLKCLAGLEEMSEGSLFIEGKDMTDMPANQRPVVMMFQQPLLFPHMTVLENVMYGLQFQKLPKTEKQRKAKAFLEKVNLLPFADVMPYELSGGQQQRVALARALVTHPRLLLLDEPFASLDNALRQEMRDWVKALLKEQETTAIFVTHDIEEAMIIGDRAAVFGEKKLQQIGPPLDVYYHPDSSFVADFYSDGFMMDAHSFVHSSKLLAAPSGNEGEFCYQWEVKVVNKRVKHGKMFYDLEISSSGKKVTLLLEEHKEIGEEMLLGVMNEEDIIHLA